MHQYRPVPLQIVREIWKARPMNVALDRLVMQNRRILFDEVRTEGKPAGELAAWMGNAGIDALAKGKGPKRFQQEGWGPVTIQ